MATIRNIICPVDFYTPSTRALDYAIRLAANYEARLHVLHVIPPLIPASYEYPIDTAAILQGLEEQSMKQLNELAHQAMDKGIQTDTSVRTGDVSEEIQWAVNAWSADLVVMGTHGRRGFQRWVLGSVTERMLRHVHIPVLIINEPVEAKTALPNIKSILVMTDFSEGTADAVKYAFSIAQESQARVTLMHVLHEIAIDIPEQYKALLIQGIEDRLRKLIPVEALDWCDAEPRVETGIPFERIVQVSRDIGADLMVMNIHGKGMLDRALIGSTAERVIRSAPCPVLAVPPMRQADRPAGGKAVAVSA